MKIIICPDKTLNVGIGHLKRCEVLFGVLKDNYEVYYTPIDFKNGLVIDYTDALYLLDTHQEISLIVKDLKNKNNKVVVMDNFNDDSRDLGINIFNHSDVDIHKTVTSFNHIILREEVFQVNPDEAREEKYVVIAIGGGDQLNMSPEIIKNLRKYYNGNVVVVQGPQSKAFALEFDNVKIIVNPSNFLQLLRNAEIVFCNAGSTLFEALIMGKKCVVFPQTHFESNIANYFNKEGHLLGVGIEDISAALKKMNEYIAKPLPFTGRGAEAIEKILRSFYV